MKSLFLTGFALLTAFVMLPTPAKGAAGDLEPLDLAVGGLHVHVTAVQPDGKTIISGEFSSVLGVPRHNIARLNADGSLDMDFDPNANNSVYCVVVQPDGKILIGGVFTALQPNGAAASTQRLRIARLNADGTLDPGFDPGASNIVFSIALQANGKVLFCGIFSYVQPNGGSAVTRNHLARVHADGTLDTTFDPNPGGAALPWVHTIAVQPDEKILLGGKFTTLQPNGAPTPTTRNYVARVNPDGTLDEGFDPNANEALLSIVPQPDGKILLGGYFTSLQPNGAATATMRRNFARIRSDGSLDETYDPNPDGAIYSMAPQADGKLMVVGFFTEFQPNGAASPTPRSLIARLNADGTVDAGFELTGDISSTTVGLRADGKVLLGGEFTFLQVAGAPSPTARQSFALLDNDTGTQTLAVPGATSVRWSRNGSLPDICQVTFETSTDGGANWSLLGPGARIGASADWELTGVSLPATEWMLRARGQTANGYLNGSGGLIEFVDTFSGQEDPGEVTTGTLVLSLDARNGVEAQDGVITRWYDRSPFGNDVLSYGAKRPSLDPPGTLGLPVPSVRFDGIDDRLLRTGFQTEGGDSLASDVTVFVVAAVRSVQVGNGHVFRALVSGLPNSADNFKDYLGGFTLDTGDVVLTSLDRLNLEGVQWPGQSDLLTDPFSVPFAEFRVFSLDNDDAGTATEMYVDGELKGSRSRASTTALDIHDFYVGARYFDNNATNTTAPGEIGWLDGNVAAVLVFEGNLSTADRMAVEAYLHSRFILGEEPPAGEEELVVMRYDAGAGPAPSPGSVDSDLITPGTQPWLGGDGFPIDDGGTPAWRYVDEEGLADWNGTIPVEQVRAGNEKGWKLTWETKAVLGNTPFNASQSPTIVYFTSPPTGVFWRMGSGVQADGDQEILVNTNDGFWLYTSEGEGEVYHRYELIYDPVTVTARLLVDGVERISGITGLEPLEVAACMTWGNGSTGAFPDRSGNDRLLEFSILGEEVTPPQPEVEPDIQIGKNSPALIADYQMQNSLESSIGNVPPLAFYQSSQFDTDTVDGESRSVVTFPAGSGLEVIGAHPLMDDTYTIAMLFRFSTVSGYRRITDFSNKLAESGLYLQSGELNYYNVASSSGAGILGETYTQVVLTRDETGKVNAYVDGVERLSFEDNVTSPLGVLGPGNVLRFFVDNIAENSAGAVARIRMWDEALGSDAVNGLDRLPDTVAPLLIGPTALTLRSGCTFCYQLAAVNAPDLFTVGGLPTWMNYDAGTHILSGTVGPAGLYLVDVSAGNGAGTTTVQISITSDDSPILTLKDGFPNPFEGFAYDGTEDAAMISRNTTARNQNFGKRINFFVADTPAEIDRSVIRFDLSSLRGKSPAIASATLRLFLYNPPSEAGTVNIYPLTSANAGWVEGPGAGGVASNNYPGSVTWAEIRRGTQGAGNAPNGTGTNWAGSQGGSTPGVDHAVAAIATYDVTGSETAAQPIDYVFNDLSVIDQWIAGDNPGLLITSDGFDSSGHSWHSSDAGSADPANAAYHPELILTLRPDGSHIAVHSGADTAAPQISSGQPGTGDFGIVGKDSAPTARAFTIHSFGSEAVDVSSISAPSGFLIDAVPGSPLVPGETFTFHVTLDTTATGTFAGDVEITSNADNGPVFTIPVAGTVQEAAFQSWGETAGLTGGNLAYQATPANDGIPNLIKYAFNMPPLVPGTSMLEPDTGTSGLPAIHAEEVGGTRMLCFEFVRRTDGPAGLVYKARIADDLDNWQDVTATPAVTPIDGSFERVRIHEPIAPAMDDAVFGRVEISLP